MSRLRWSVFGVPLCTLCMLVVLDQPGVSAQTQDTPSNLAADLRLPEAAMTARGNGVPNDQLVRALEVMEKSKVTPHEAAQVLLYEVQSIARWGNVRDFGTMMETLLNQGIRGKDLQDKIDQVHKEENRGIPRMGLEQAPAQFQPTVYDENNTIVVNPDAVPPPDQLQTSPSKLGSNPSSGPGGGQ